MARPRHEVRLSVGIPKCLFGFKEPRIGLSGDDYLKQETATYVVLEALFGPGSDLYQSLYDDGLIDENFGFDYSLERGYGFSVIGGDTPDPDALIKRVEEEIPRVLDKGVSRRLSTAFARSGWVRCFGPSIHRSGSPISLPAIVLIRAICSGQFPSWRS